MSSMLHAFCEKRSPNEERNQGNRKDTTVRFQFRDVEESLTWLHIPTGNIMIRAWWLPWGRKVTQVHPWTGRALNLSDLGTEVPRAHLPTSKIKTVWRPIIDLWLVHQRLQLYTESLVPTCSKGTFRSWVESQYIQKAGHRREAPGAYPWAFSGPSTGWYGL